METPFLTARWSNLAILSYDVDPSLLNDHLPPDCALDTIDGRAFVSLVAFDFLDTRVLDVAWPGFVNFPEINLRYYVRGPGGRRGVAFIREFVPQKIVAAIALAVYNEPYLAVPMRSEIERANGRIVTHHTVRFCGRDHSIRVSGSTQTIRPADGSTEHFFKEHSWGYGLTRDRRLITYEVRHPVWKIYPDARIEALDWNFGAIYGRKFEFLGAATPFSIAFAVGSEVAVFPKGIT
ncbi:hypothetical protein BH09PLA1_BH09PLA1_05250 [soil metagenome]